jgi:hypothetical protein
VTFDPAVAAAELLGAMDIDASRTVDRDPRPEVDVLAGPVLAGIPLRVVGVGWATVELDRAATELRATGRWTVEPAQPDTLLGAAARIGRRAEGGPLAVLLEPFTEGRVAAFLARHGEAPAVLYVAPREGGLAAALALLAATGARIRGGDGPLGPGALVLDRSAGEPQLVLVAVPSGP